MPFLFQPEHYPLLERAVAYLETHYQEQPELNQIAQHMGLSPGHFQRVFKEGVGISPKRFLQYTTLKHARVLLKSSHNVLETAYAVGLSGSGRLHDLFITCDALTPGEYKTRGEGLCLRFGEHNTPFGPARLVLSERGICGLDFLPDRRQKEADALTYLRQLWPGAEVVADMEATAMMIDKIFFSKSPQHLPLYLKGSNFQVQVWQALLRIPEGQVVSYGQICSHLKQPGAARAVGSAVGKNPISFLIPCHRVLRQDGGIGGYAGGTVRKRILLASEALNRSVDEKTGGVQ